MNTKVISSLIFTDEELARMRATASENIKNLSKNQTIQALSQGSFIEQTLSEEEEEVVNRAIAKKEIIRCSVTVALCFGNLLATLLIGYTLFQALHTPKPSSVPPVVINR